MQEKVISLKNLFSLRALRLCAIISLFIGAVVVFCFVMVNVRDSTTTKIPPIAPAPRTWFVAKGGNDTWSGRLPDPNDSGTDGPFATLERARDEVRQWRHNAFAESETGKCRVFVREGVYTLTKPFTLGPDDSGTKESPIIYEACPGEQVTLKGSVNIKSWIHYRGRIYRTDLTEDDIGPGRFWQLFYKGKRQHMARYPDFNKTRPSSGGFLYVSETLDTKTLTPLTYSPSQFLKTASRVVLKYDPSRLNPAKWSKPTEVRIHIWPWMNWCRTMIGVKSFDLEKHTLELQQPAPYPLMEGNRFFVENALEELDSPGEWYYDEGTKRLYFWSPDGSNPEGHVSVAILPVLVKFQGDEEGKRFVSHVILRGFTLCESSNALISLQMAAHCTVAECTLEQCGGTAIELSDRSQHNCLIGCDIAYVGEHGIALNEVRDWTHGLENRISHNVVCNNHIHHVGELQTAVGAVVIGPGNGGNVSHDNTICHNLIHDTPHQGISFNGFHNIVEYNHIHHTNLEYADSGAIGMGSRDIYERGSVIRYNFIHDTGGYSMKSPGVWEYPRFTWGIYLDDFTSGVHVYGNVIARAARGGIKVHGGQDNIIENNVIVDCHGQQIEYDAIDSRRTGISGRNPAHPDTNLWLMTGTRSIGNVFSWKDKKALWIAARAPKWKQMIVESDRNLIWHHGHPPAVGLLGKIPDDGSWTKWQGMGFDSNSIVVDPLFVDPAHDDFQLRSNSPAFALGFKPIPMERIGLFESPDRASWPVNDNDRRERHVTRIRSWLF
jgi:hypothetical protein